MLKVIETLNYKSQDDIRFLTVKSNEIKKIGKVSDMCRKVSDTFFIVRELNKATPGFHYHVIMKMNKEPHKGWYKKGWHIHLLKVGKPQTMVTMQPPSPGFSKKELYEIGQHDKTNARVIEMKQIESRLIDTVLKTKYYDTSVERVIRYMYKEFISPQRYINYILCIKGSQKCLDPLEDDCRRTTHASEPPLVGGESSIVLP